SAGATSAQTARSLPGSPVKFSTTRGGLTDQRGLGPGLRLRGLGGRGMASSFSMRFAYFSKVFGQKKSPLGKLEYSADAPHELRRRRPRAHLDQIQVVCRITGLACQPC